MLSHSLKHLTNKPVLQRLLTGAWVLVESDWIAGCNPKRHGCRVWSEQAIPKVLLMTFLKSLVILSCAFMVSCSTSHKKDGPPKYNVDVSHIPNASPKVEPLAKYGNMRSYRVFGKQYYVKKSSNNYEEVGTASWYGTQFHDKRTSSGEPYNMLSMTAAHKTLPLPTYVEVTNLANQKKIIVKVNDRGPFASNRIIDLSYVAAKKLGMLGKGTAHVRVRAIDPRNFGQQRTLAKSIIKAPVESAEFGPKIYVQAGAFLNRAYAEDLQSTLGRQLKAPVHVAAPSFGGKYYRVHIGPFKDPGVAQQVQSRLQQLGIKSKTVSS